MDVERRNRIVVRNLHLVKAIAAGIRKSLPNHVELNDLVQTGNLGLIDAAEKYDPDKMVTFSSYARHRIRGAILDGLRRLDCAPRGLRKQYKEMTATTDELAVSLNRAPSEAEVAEKMGIRLVQLRNLRSDLRRVSNSCQSPNNEAPTSLDPPCEVKAQPDSITECAQLRTALQEVVKTLPTRHRRIVMLYDYHDLPMAEIAKRFGLHESRVSQIRTAALRQMGRVLRARGIDSSRMFLT